MDIVFKGKGDLVTIHQNLDLNHSENIGAWYQGRELLSSESASILEEIRQMGGMLACQCASPSPIMHVRRNKQSYSLVINQKSQEHNDQCVFHNNYHRISEKDILKKVERTIKCNLVKSNWKTNSNDLLNQYNLLKKCIKKIDLTPGVNLSLYFDTMPGSVNKLAGRMRKYKKSWQDGDEFAAVLAIVSDTVVNNQINYTHKLKTGSFSIPGQNTLAYDIQGPYLSIIKIAENHSGYIQPMAAHSIPIMSRQTLVKVQTDGHRVLLRKLMQLQQWWREKHHLDIDICAVYHNHVDFELFNNKELVARTSCIETFKDKQILINTGMDVIYFEHKNTSEEKERHFAKMLTARILSREHYHDAI